MKKFENQGITSKVTNKKISIEIPIPVLVTAFEYYPNNYDESKVKRGKRQMFAEFVAEKIIDDRNSETGDTPFTSALDSVFDLLMEGYEDGREFIKFGEDEC